VQPDRELAFLHTLPVERLWGVGAVTARRLHQVGITTVGQLAALTEGTLVSLLGRAAGRHIHALASNRVPRPIQARRRRRSIGAHRALGRSRKSAAGSRPPCWAWWNGSPDARGGAWADCYPRLRFDDFARDPLHHAETRHGRNADVLGMARGLPAAAMPTIELRGITLIGLAVTNLENDLPRQLKLPFACSRRPALDAALDEIRDRYGVTALSRAVLLGRDAGLVMPMLPD
jgi:DNA polymerase-4